MNKKVVIISINVIIFIIIVYFITRNRECKGYLQDGKCVDICSEGYYINQKNCTKICPNYIQDGQCVAKCSVGKFIKDNFCVDKCPMVSDGKTCLSSCPSTKRNENGVCKFIPEQLYFSTVEGLQGLNENKLTNVYNDNPDDFYFDPSDKENTLTFTFNNGPYYVINFYTKIYVQNPINYKGTPYTYTVSTTEGVTTIDSYKLVLFNDKDDIIYQKDIPIDKENDVNNTREIYDTLSNPTLTNKIKYKITPSPFIYEINFYGRKTN